MKIRLFFNIKASEMKLSAGMVIVRQNGGKTYFLFLRAYRLWDFPKGEVEPDESPLETARREVKEETGVTDLKFPWGHTYTETEPYRSGKHRKKARYYIARTHLSDIQLPVNPELGRPEHHEYRWVTYPELKKLAPDRLQPVVEWAHRIVS
jgi:bis(5'-nucleosidyl)-tetraphosphatase